ncbi:hypothetical protein [Pectobacterium phage PcCB7V]|nr:hypothetical protein [Pectobacterium phage PcCB7V]
MNHSRNIAKRRRHNSSAANEERRIAGYTAQQARQMVKAKGRK